MSFALLVHVLRLFRAAFDIDTDEVSLRLGASEGVGWPDLEVFGSKLGWLLHWTAIKHRFGTSSLHYD